VITSQDLMRLHVEAEFTCDVSGRLLTVNDSGAAPAPRFFLGRTAHGNAWWFRGDVSVELARDLDALCRAQPTGLDVAPGSADTIIARLARDAPVQRTWTGPAFYVPSSAAGHDAAVRVTPDNASLLSPHLEDWRGDVTPAVPMFVMLDDGKAVSICASVRLTSEAHEAGVDTHRDFRGRGYAGHAVRAWASAVRAMGRVPLYSTSWDNEASRAVARKLGLILFGVDLHVT
jgi:RimJ/RimL family protein N-acetyltransferase